MTSLENLGNASVLTWTFYICFYFCFNLICLFFFISIIISNFHQLKNNINLTATAFSRIKIERNDSKIVESSLPETSCQ